MTQNASHPFIAYLQSLGEGEDRGALASLRRGLGRKPGSVPEMYRYVVPFIPQNIPTGQEAAYYLVASLFALHPKSSFQGNLGDHLAATRDQNNSDALERRFTSLLTAHPDDLPDYLRQIVSYLKSKEVPVNWDQLFRDLQSWDHPDWRENVQRHWARTFWRRSPLLDQSESAR